MNEKQWCKKAKKESQKIVKVFKNLEEITNQIDLEEIYLKSKEIPFKVQYVEWDVFKIVEYIYEISRGIIAIKTDLPKEAKAFAVKVYKSNMDDISGTYRRVYVRAIHHIGEAVEKESQKEKKIEDSIRLLETAKNIIKKVNNKTYNLEGKEELYELIQIMKQMFFIANNLKVAEPELFGKISEICSKVSYNDISEIGMQYYEITPTV